MSGPVRVGTRRSRLATVQTRSVLLRLARAAPGLSFVPSPVDTSGDQDRTVGGSTDFTDTIDRALLRGEIDLAVHSAKDLPVLLDRRLRLVACPRRADPRDCLVVRDGLRADRLPRGARIGSSSPRRCAQLLRWRPDLRVVEVRGNVDTRLGLVRSRKVDAAVLAVAGIARLRRRSEIDAVLPADGFLPAPGQGALAVVARAGARRLSAIAGKIDHGPTRRSVEAERAFAAALGGDCTHPLGALAEVRGGALRLAGEVLSPDGRRSVHLRVEGDLEAPERLGRSLARTMLTLGAAELLSLPPA